MSNAITHVARFLRHYGVSKTLREATPFLKEAIFHRDARLEREEAFDVRYGVDTGGEIWPWELDSLKHAANAEGAYFYQAISERGMETALDHIDTALPATTLIDIGAGKGRAMMIAARRRFKRVLGVELSSELHAIGMRNIAQFKRSGEAVAPLDLRHADALTFDLPPGPLALFLYNPFLEAVLAPFVARIERHVATQRVPVTILYANPVYGHVLELSKAFKVTHAAPELMIAVSRPSS